MAVGVVLKLERLFSMPLADVSNTEWRNKVHRQQGLINFMPLADVSNTEWRKELRLASATCFAMPLADVSNTEWRSTRNS